MRILILANNDIGLYRFRKELIVELVKNNEVYISLPNGEFVKNLVDMGCLFIDTIISRHGTNPVNDLKLLLFYKKIIKAVKPDLVLTYTIKPNIYGGLACSSLKVPYIANVTGLGNAVENKGLLQKITIFLYRNGLKKASHVFFQNQDNLLFMLNHKIKMKSYELLPGSGVNLSENKFEEYPKDDKHIVFVTIGRILKDKGIDELLSAIRILKQKHSNLSFKLIGGMDGDYEKTINDAVSEKLIEYLGHRNDIHELIKFSHATIHPSYHEGTSNVLLETASCGRPIIASNVPGCNNTFDNNKTGIAFEPKNVKSLVKAIEEFIDLPYDNKKSMGILGRRKIEKEFDRNIVINRYLKAISIIKQGAITNETL